MVTLEQIIADNKIKSGDRITTFTEVSWSDYEWVLKTKGERSVPSISYLDGVLTIVSSGRNHERVKEIIGDLIKIYCDEAEIDYYPWASTTLKQEDESVGKEPDISYCFNNDKDKPDLAIEVVYTNGGKESLEKYRRLSIKEIWFWQNNSLSIYVLDNLEYSQWKQSYSLPNLDLSLLSEFVGKMLVGNIRLLKREFVKRAFENKL